MSNEEPAAEAAAPANEPIEILEVPPPDDPIEDDDKKLPDNEINRERTPS